MRTSLTRNDFIMAGNGWPDYFNVCRRSHRGGNNPWDLSCSVLHRIIETTDAAATHSVVSLSRQLEGAWNDHSKMHTMNKSSRSESFREQMAQAMKELRAIIASGKSPTDEVGGETCGARKNSQEFPEFRKICPKPSPGEPNYRESSAPRTFRPRPDNQCFDFSCRADADNSPFGVIENGPVVSALSKVIV